MKLEDAVAFFRTLPLLMFAAPALAQTSPVDLARLCPREAPQRVGAREGAEIKRLDRLPPGEQYLAVLRREDGCTRPQLVREYRDLVLGRR